MGTNSLTTLRDGSLFRVRFYFFFCVALPHPPFDFALLCGSFFFFFLVGPASRPLPALPLAGLSFRTWEVHPAGAKPLKAVFHAQPVGAG